MEMIGLSSGGLVELIGLYSGDLVELIGLYSGGLMRSTCQTVLSRSYLLINSS